MRKDCEIEINYITNNCIVVIKDLLNKIGDKESLEQALCIGPCVDIYFLMDSVLGCMQGCERK